jgi:hypothetical protein
MPYKSALNLADASYYHHSAALIKLS